MNGLGISHQHIKLNVSYSCIGRINPALLKYEVLHWLFCLINVCFYSKAITSHWLSDCYFLVFAGANSTSPKYYPLHQERKTHFLHRQQTHTHLLNLYATPSSYFCKVHYCYSWSILVSHITSVVRNLNMKVVNSETHTLLCHTNTPLFCHHFVSFIFYFKS